MKKLTATILFIFAVLYLTPAFSAESVHLYLKGNRKAIKESKIIGNTNSASLGTYGPGEYIISVPKDLIKPIAIDEPGVHKSQTKSDVSSDEEVQKSSSGGVKQTMQTQVRKSGSIIVMADGVEIARKPVSIGDLDGDGALDFAFSLGKGSDASDQKWSVEIKFIRIEMK